jgi:flagellar motor component MotA
MFRPDNVPARMSPLSRTKNSIRGRKMVKSCLLFDFRGDNVRVVKQFAKYFIPASKYKKIGERT